MRKSKGSTRRRAYVGNERNYIRSRTIVGYEPSNDYSELELERKKIQGKIKRQKIRRTTLVVFLIILGLAIFIFSQMVVVISGVEYNDSTISRGQDEDYLVAVNQYLMEYPSERFSFSRDDDLLTSYVEKKYPEVGNVIIRGGFGAGKLYLEIRQPVAVWKTGSNSSFVDKNGAVFEKNYYKDPDIIINDYSSSGTISQRFLQFIGKIIAGISESELGQVEKVSIPAGAIRYVEITISGYSYPIKIQTDRDTNAQIADVVNMVKYLDRNEISPNYVDVRVKNRGFWK